ncbi:histidine kinase [Acinetobacter oleivorans]|uniref:putative bifunctional diguanylate cyclase/phosphodiesterase n=1 Tax=Acinetobacter oleivorans TaxID=1148157 RepID=UPI000D31CFC5|nr:GGDEF domain-containing phosphodiesterase [Acinetobacter oleivorans]PTV43431.1 histidine kinase [Acinetobacter oleivorans]
MSGLQEEYLQHQTKIEQLKLSIQYIRWYLISLILLCLISYAIFSYYFLSSITIFNWSMGLTIASLICLLFVPNILTHYRTINFIKKTDLILQSICFISGVLLGATVTVIHFYLPQELVTLPDAHILIALFITSAHIIGLTFLTQQPRYFYLLFIPSTLPLLIAQFTHTPITQLPFYFAYNIAFIATILCAYATQRNYQKISQLLFRNKQLIQISEQHTQWAEELCVQLQQEVNKSKDIEAQLQFNNHLLEQKVRERTYDLTKMNEQLESHHYNLAFANETAGIRPWDWDIENQKLEITFFDQQKQTQTTVIHLNTILDRVHPSDKKLFNERLKQHLEGITDHFNINFRILRRDGSWRWIHDVGRVITRDPKTQKALRMVGMTRDIHQEKKDQEHLRLSAIVLEQAAEGIFILDEHLNYIDINPYYEKLTGFSKSELLNKELFSIAINQKELQQQFHTSITQQLLETGEYMGQFDEKFSSGKSVYLWLHINVVKDEFHQITNYIGFARDLTEQKRQEQHLSYLKNYDSLTHLPNRLYYYNQLHQYLVNPSYNIKNLALIRVNIDRFRAFNEFLNNDSGDELLKQFAQRLRLININAILVAYLNSDDFAIIYEISPIHPNIEQYCQNILQALNAPFYIDNHEYFITASIGVACFPEHGRQIDHLNNHAEQALSEAKRLGGNTISYYCNKAEHPYKTADLEQELRKAIQNDEFVIYYQPKINLLDQSIIGFEALIRWQHPEKGLVMPNMFIPFAERSSLISDIGKVVLDKVGKQLQEWKNAGYTNVQVSVNIVAQQIHRGLLLNDLDEVLQKYNIQGSDLELEITESALLDNTDNVKTLLHAIKQRDISIALDDFGTGYSSLAYLTEYPIDVLKIDRAFISKIGDHKQEAIVNAMIAMGKSMGLKLVAEGVETEEQVAYLQKQQCDFLQGYFFSRPIPAEQILPYLQTDSHIY